MEDSRINVTSPEATAIVKQCHSALRQVLQGRFQCTTQIHNIEDGAALSFSHNKVAIVPEIKYSRQMSKHLMVSVWKDDLTTHKVDAVVNAANELLKHGAGLAGALSQAGGPSIQQFSDTIIQQIGKLEAGDVVCTPPGKLPCQIILHAVGPRVSPNPTSGEIRKASKSLQKAVENILIHACSEKVQSVAIPAISSGIFNFPLASCAEIIVKTVKSFGHKFNAQDKNLEVRLVNNDDPSVQEMLNACVRILGPSEALPMQTVGNPPTQSQFPSLDLGNVTLYLKKGAIEDETTDVIVNTIGIDLDLLRGQVSKALLRKAGGQFQKELKQQKPGYGDDGDIIVTSGCKLNCKAVYHAVCARKHPGNYSEKILYSVVTNCLILACSKGYSSIAFPALGTGNLGLQKDDVAHTMINAVEEFSKTNSGVKIKIFLVIFPRDTETLKAFEVKMKSTNTKLPTLQVSSSTNGKNFHRSPRFETPFIELLALNPEAHQEAKLWLKRILCFFPDKLEIHNNNIVHLSLEDHEKLMSLQSAFHVDITEMFKNGHVSIIIKGEPVGVSCTALEVEAMLCQAQEDFAQNEEKYMQSDLADFGQPIVRLYESNKLYQKTPLTTWDRQNWIKSFSDYSLRVVKVEKIENPALKHLFMLNSKRIQAPPQCLYQCVRAQFCDLICRVGFQRGFAPPEEQKYGAGIYFTSDPRKAKQIWPENEDEYIYFVEAQVLTGKDAPGSPELILPPPVGSDPLVRYDSVTNNNGIHIIFNGQQANPEFLITCRKIDSGTFI